MTEEYRVITNPFVKVTVTSNISSFAAERRFQRDLTIGALKVRIELNCISITTAMPMYKHRTSQFEGLYHPVLF